MRITDEDVCKKRIQSEGEGKGVGRGGEDCNIITSLPQVLHCYSPQYSLLHWFRLMQPKSVPCEELF